MEFNSVIIILFFSILFILLIICVKLNRNDELFVSLNNNPENDGKMLFDYLTNKNYGENIINKYYQNDDTKINGINVINHPYKDKLNYLFGIAPYIKMTSEQSDNIYNSSGVRL